MGIHCTTDHGCGCGGIAREVINTDVAEIGIAQRLVPFRTQAVVSTQSTGVSFWDVERCTAGLYCQLQLCAEKFFSFVVRFATVRKKEQNEAKVQLFSIKLEIPPQPGEFVPQRGKAFSCLKIPSFLFFSSFSPKR
eukprot:TRINITY_DN6263_c0_g1_i4.p1 TRINITY_DN6263_c0_g1~~TRINITY_DN6263_c0_g1_i4.p1  ORF type:complete len:136 (-),score=23.44 TRINITY_DN6263_c0_g1_i4:252-659(-)